MNLLLDTHVLIWWTLDPKKLSLKARNACDKIIKNDAFISSISIWEIGVKIKNKKLDIGMPIDLFTKKIKNLGTIKVISVDENILLKNLSLNWKNKDPADRTIVATAMIYNCQIISKDKEISNFYKYTIW